MASEIRCISMEPMLLPEYLLQARLAPGSLDSNPPDSRKGNHSPSPQGPLPLHPCLFPVTPSSLLPSPILAQSLLLFLRH